MLVGAGGGQVVQKGEIDAGTDALGIKLQLFLGW